MAYNRKSNSYTFITGDGNVDESRAFQRKPILERWDVDTLADVKVTPWSTRVMESAVRVDMGAEVDGHPPPVPDVAPEARRVRIIMELLHGFGFTESCKQ